MANAESKAQESPPQRQNENPASSFRNAEVAPAAGAFAGVRFVARAHGRDALPFRDDRSEFFAPSAAGPEIFCIWHNRLASVH